MLIKLLFALAMMGVCVALHATGVVSIVRWIQARHAQSRTIASSAFLLIRVAMWTVLLHLAQIVVWAGAYAAGRAMPDFVTAAYFSAVTYTTTGYGDLVLPKDWRIVGGVEALTGILMCGVSTGMFFAVFSEIFGLWRRSTPASQTSL